MAAEAAVISDMSQMYGAVITPHQSICGDLAAWPKVVYVSRLVRYLGAHQQVHVCARAKAGLVYAYFTLRGPRWAVSGTWQLPVVCLRRRTITSMLIVTQMLHCADTESREQSGAPS